MIDQEKPALYAQNLFRKLDGITQHVCQSLFDCLHKITKKSEENRMGAANISTCIAPNILHPEKTDPLEMVEQMAVSNLSVATIIKLYNQIFTEDFIEEITKNALNMIPKDFDSLHLNTSKNLDDSTILLSPKSPKSPKSPNSLSPSSLLPKLNDSKAPSPLLPPKPKPSHIKKLSISINHTPKSSSASNLIDFTSTSNTPPKQSPHISHTKNASLGGSARNLSEVFHEERVNYFVNVN